MLYFFENPVKNGNEINAAQTMCLTCGDKTKYYKYILKQPQKKCSILKNTFNHLSTLITLSLG